MASNHGDAVLEECIRALELSEPAAAEDSHESQYAIDLLPGPIWHIIFRHLLLPPASSSQLQKQGQSCEKIPSSAAYSNLCDLVDQHPAGDFISLQNRPDFYDELELEASTTSCATTRPLSASEQHEENTRRFGSSWPLLRCAMASKRLFEHLISFSELEPICLAFNSEEPRWTEMLSRFLKLSGHKSLDLLFISLTDLQSLGCLMASSAHSLTSLSLRLTDCLGGKSCLEGKDCPGGLYCLGGKGIAHDPIQRNLINLAFLGKFWQLQRLKLGRGRWQLSSVNAAWFPALRSLTIDHVDCNNYDHNFLSFISPQLHEFSLSTSTRRSSFLNLEFKAARIITISYELTFLDACFTLPSSLKSFSAAANILEIDWKRSSPLSLDALTLIGHFNLVVFPLPLVCAKTVLLNGSTHRETPKSLYDIELFRGPVPQLSLTQLLSSIAPTVESLIVRHGWPLEKVKVEWSCLRCLVIGVDNWGPDGGRYMTTVEDFPLTYSRRRDFGGEGESSSNSKLAELSPPVITAPKLECIFFATRQWHPEMLACLPINFPSLTLYRIVGRSFHWEGEGEKWSQDPVVQMRADYAACTMKAEDMEQDDRIMRFLQTL